MRIEDDELRELFQQESSEHLETLEHGLLNLEADPNDAELVHEVFRAAHSLKGAARVVGAAEAQTVMHHFEDVLGQARRGTLTLSADTIDRFYQTLDAVRGFCEQAITGTPAPYDANEIVRQLKNNQPPAEVKQPGEPLPSPLPVDTPKDSDASADPEPITFDAAASAAKIEDETLRDLFKAESREHIDCLERGLTHLEQQPQDAARLEEVFRAAHSLKGAAGMVAVEKVEALAHLFEEALGKAHKGGQHLTESVIDRLYAAVDSLRDFCDEAVTGHPVITDLETVIARLNGTGDELTVHAPADATPTVTTIDSTATAIAAPSEPRESALATPKQPSPFNIDTIRVASAKLDLLMSQAGELAVTRGRIANRVTQVEELLALWEQWNRVSYGVRTMQKNPSNELSHRDSELLLEYVHADKQRMDDFGDLLKALEAAVQRDDARVDVLASQLADGIRSVRMLPLSTVFNFFPRMVRDLARTEGKLVELDVIGGQTTADKRILEELKDPLTHMLRNAIDHGIETPDRRQASGKPATATLLLSAYQRGPSVVIEVTDDGRGINVDVIRKAALKRRIVSEADLAAMSEIQIQHLIFAPGFSTQQFVTDISGRGVGMDVVRANIERLRGSIEVESRVGQGTTFRLVLPLTVATRRVLLVAVGDAKFAVPVESVQTNRLVSHDEIFSMQGRGTILLAGEPVPIAKLADVLELPTSERSPTIDPMSATSYLECLILNVDSQRFGFLVDELVDEQEVVVKPHGAVLRNVRNVAGSTILENGDVCITLNPVDLMRSVMARPVVGKLETTIGKEERKKVILLAEDSIVTRTQEKRILETAGFNVVTAVDGEDAYNKLMAAEFDGVVSDVEMPNLSGLDLTAKIRSQVQYENLPVILVTSLSTDEDRKRGMEVGADAYLTKPGFDQRQFVDTVKRLV